MCLGSCTRPPGELRTRTWARVPVLSPADVTSVTSKRPGRRGTRTAVHTDRHCKGTPGTVLQRRTTENHLGLLLVLLKQRDPGGDGSSETSGRRPPRAAPRGLHPGGAPCRPHSRAVTRRRGSTRSQRGAGRAARGLQRLKPLAPAGCLPRAICPVNCSNSEREQLQKSSLSSYKPGKGWERHKQ